MSKRAIMEVLLSGDNTLTKDQISWAIANIPNDNESKPGLAFNHDAEKRWFGSVEKMEKYGIQDDFIFSLGWNLYGARNMSVDDFRYRKTISSFGTLYPNKDLLGHYA